jgi:hypothetical protein
MIGRLEFLPMAKETQCFDFGNFRDVTHFKEHMWSQKMIPFPAPICWYEGIHDDTGRTAYLVDSRSNDFLRVSLFTEEETIFGGWVRLDYDFDQISFYMNDNIWPISETQVGSLRHIILTALYLTIIVASKDVTISDRIMLPMQRAIGKVAKIDMPRFSYRTVTVKPERLVMSQSKISYSDSEPAYSQRYHFRIGHWRYLSNGSKVAVRGYWAGNKALGAIEKDYDCTDLIKHDLFSEPTPIDGKMPWRKPKVSVDLFA